MSNYLPICSKIKSFFSTKAGIIAVTIFGSYVKGSNNSKSDVDVAVLFHPRKLPNVLDLIQWQEDLSDEVSIPVDLVCLNTASLILAAQVVQEGELLIKNDSDAYAQYLMYLYSDYAELKELRAPAEKNILKRRYFE